jgi:hypothetical protein
MADGPRSDGGNSWSGVSGQILSALSFVDTRRGWGVDPSTVSGLLRSTVDCPVTTTPIGTPRSTATTTLLSAGSMPYTSWSPDGSWLLVRAGGQLRLFDDQGHEVRSLAGDRAVWPDAGTFLAIGPSGSTWAPSAPTPRHGSRSYLRSGCSRMGTAHLPRDWLVRCGRGLLFWTPAGATNPRPGEPVAWSRNGTRLAVWHNLHAGPGPVCQLGGSRSSAGLGWPPLCR